MGKKLVIAEKPSLARKIVSAFAPMEHFDGYYENRNYIVTYAFGHILVLKDIEDYMGIEKGPWSMDILPFVPEKFEYKIPDSVKGQYQIIKDLYCRKDVGGIINAGDPDREGSVIILNIVNSLQRETGRVLPVERSWLKATEPDFIRENFANLKKEEDYGNLYEEGLARSFYDWIFGINYSRAATLLSGGARTLPVGRVKLQIVRYVYDRDKEIASFKPVTYFVVGAGFEKDGEPVTCTLSDVRFELHERGIGEQLIRKLQQSVMRVENVEEKTVTKKPPKLFSLSTLQNKMSAEYKFSLDHTLECVQKLYEAGYVTYPRTNTEYMSTAEQGHVNELVEMLAKTGPYPLKMRGSKDIFDDSKIEGHTALIITGKIPAVEKLEEDEASVYRVIKNRFLANFIEEPCKIAETSVTLSNGEYGFKLKGHAVVQPGWMAVEKSKKDKYIPKFVEGETLSVSYELVEKKTSPPGRVTEAQLNEFLENPFRKKEVEEMGDDEEYRAILSGCEIGTVATRSSALEGCIDAGYIARDHNVLTITPLGAQFIKVMYDMGVDMRKENTALMGMELKKIFRNEMTKEDLIRAVSDEVSATIKNCTGRKIYQIQTDDVRCPVCRRGKMIRGKKNIYCNRYKDQEDPCKFSLSYELKGYTLTDQQLRMLLLSGRTNVISGFKKPDGKGTYSAVLSLEKDGTVKWNFPKTRKKVSKA